MAIDIKEKYNSDKASVEYFVSGRIDTTTAPVLQTKLWEKFNNVIDIIVDLSAVEYISSAGLRVLLLLYKSAGTQKRVIFRKPSSFCMQIFEATGMADVFKIEK